MFPTNIVDDTAHELCTIVEDLGHFVSKPNDHPAIKRILLENAIYPSKRFTSNKRTLPHELLNNVKIIQRLYCTLGKSKIKFPLLFVTIQFLCRGVVRQHRGGRIYERSSQDQGYKRLETL